MILVTDCYKQFELFTGNKILISQLEILETSCLKSSVVQEINSLMNGYENEAAKKAIAELTEYCNSPIDFHFNKFSETISSFEKKYAVLYTYFQNDVKNTFCVEKLCQLILEHVSDTICFHLSEKHIRLRTALAKDGIQFEFKKEPRDFLKIQIKSSLKRIRWKFKKQKKVKPPVNKTQICIVCFNTPSDYTVYYKTLEHLKSNHEIHVNIVEIDSGIHQENARSLESFTCENIHFYRIEDFAGSHASKVNYLKFQKEIAAIDPDKYRFDAINRYTNEVYYATFEVLIDTLNPDVIWYNNTSEIGRCLALVGIFKKTPVICIDYALFSNDYLHMASRIRFTARLCISDYTSHIWKDKLDPTPIHKKIGLLKLDDFQKSEQPERISNQKTLFFASTWGGTNPLYNHEKKIIIEQLIDYCAKKNFMLIVKKHPAENDDVLSNLKKLESTNFRIYEHDEISMYEALAISDFAITQNSSIGAEAMLYHIPTIYFNLSNNENTKSIIAINNADFVFFVESIDDMDQIVNNERMIIPKETYERSIAYFLYKLDGKAYLRLIEETLNIKDSFLKD